MNGKTDRIEYPIERLLRDAGYIQIYDGQTSPQKKTEQFNVPPEDRQVFIRRYQQIQNNHFVNKYVKLIYNLRKGECDAFDYKIKPGGLKQSQNMLTTIGLTKGIK